MIRPRLRSVLVGGFVLVVAGVLPGSISPAAGDDDRPPAQQSGGGSLPGVKTPVPPGADGAVNPVADAAPAVSATFVDEYSRAWRQVEKGKLKVRSLGEDLVAARQVVATSSSDFALAIRVRNRASAQLGDAQSQFDDAVKALYISGTTDVDLVLGVLGSRPDDVLRTIDSLTYLRSATGRESTDVTAAQEAAIDASSATASVLIRVEDDRNRVATIARTLARTKKELKGDQEELQSLVAVAAPQTVVGPSGCPTEVLAGTLPPDVDVTRLCKRAVRNAPTPQAAFAIKWALVRLGAPYACDGIGRLEPWRYDCSSYVSRAYAEGAGLKTAGDAWAPSTRNMVPWDGTSLDPHYAIIPPDMLQPGDLVLYDTCPAGETCTYRHVAMYLGTAEDGGQPLMAQTNACGSVAHVAVFPGTDVPTFLGVRRVIPLKGEKIVGNIDPPPGTGKGRPRPSKPRPSGAAGDEATGSGGQRQR